jgi:Putative peptidoglycan binding domain
MKFLSALVTGSVVTIFLAVSQPSAKASGGFGARSSGGGGHAFGGASVGHTSGGRFFGGSRGGFAGGWHGGGGHWHHGFWHHHHFFPGFWGPGWWGWGGGWGWYGYPYYPYGYGYYDYGDPGYDYGPGYGDYSGQSRSMTEDVQAELRRQGYYRGRIDGVIGPSTREAIRSFQEDRGLPSTGRIDRALLHAMRFA